MNTLDKFKSLCDIVNYTEEYPVLNYLWVRDFENLKVYFFIEHDKSYDNRLVLNEHSTKCWDQFLLFSERLLSSAFDLRIFLLQHDEWFQNRLRNITEPQREQVMHVVSSIINYIEDFQKLCKRRENDLFWSKLFQVSLKDYPYVQMYLNIALH